ncbi:hypothetical protein CJD44_21260 [Streptomyces sp. alain-838]|nr:hypothetical protein CJD44_21260 [Streptomyces sp. alain-838]
MSVRASTSIDLRPSRSPKCPKIAPPTGRATNAMANVDRDSSVPVSGSAEGKNRSLKTREAAVP